MEPLALSGGQLACGRPESPATDRCGGTVPVTVHSAIGAGDRRAGAVGPLREVWVLTAVAALGLGEA